MTETILKTRKPRKKKIQTRIDTDSITGVNPLHTHGFGLWGNPRIVIGIRVDKGLYKAFKQVAKAKFGSTCNPIESFMAGVVGSYTADLKLGVNPSNTVSIGEIKIERNLRERRKLTRTHTETEVLEENIEREVTVTCGFNGCSGVVVAHGLYKPKNLELPLCEKHLGVAIETTGDWRILPP